MGPKGESDTKMNWSTDRRPYDKLNFTVVCPAIEVSSFWRTQQSGFLPLLPIWGRQQIQFQKTGRWPKSKNPLFLTVIQFTAH
jgi:hypothetical protein